MKKLSIFLIISMVGFFQYCSSSRKTSTTTTETAPPKPVAMTYAGNLQPTLEANCSPCHFPPRGNKLALDNYNAVKQNIGDMISRISKLPGERGFMPFKHDRLSDSVIHIFVQWQADGLLEK
ncbi:MAG: hypothetical protein ABI741_07100 [Ferruginibacter sp.]